MFRANSGGSLFCLTLLLGVLGLTTVACVGPGGSVGSGVLAREIPQVQAKVLRSMETLVYDRVEPGKTLKLRFEKDDPQLLIDGYQSRFKAFMLPTSGRGPPVKILVETHTSFEVPYYPLKSLFCPRILFLDAGFRVVYSSVFKDLKKKQRLFGEPRFVFEYTLRPEGLGARYLVVVRERSFDGQHLSSMYADKSGQYDNLHRKKRERIYSARTGPVHIRLQQLQR
ncbi:MAG: hypothetical protein GXP09_00300 [Gammaproteobacteria bacterium]|nr:hypothetical protein [Gammaproteobacteria bacterium]